MDNELVEHIIKALDDVAVIGLEGQKDNLRAADIMQRIKNGDLVVVKPEEINNGNR